MPKYTIRGKQRLVLLRPVGEGFHLYTLYYADEVADFAEVERPDVRVKPGELELAVRLIEDLAQAELRPEQYADEYRVRVRAVVERKRAGGTMGATEPQTPPTTVDLVATLKKSLEARRPLAKAGRERTGPEEACSTTKGAIVPITPRSESLRRLVRAPSRWIKVPDRAFREGPPLGDNNSDIFRTQCDLARLNPDFEP